MHEAQYNSIATGSKTKTQIKTSTVTQMDEHTDWVNQLIYLNQAKSVLSCSNDTTIKLWKVGTEGFDEGYHSYSSRNRLENPLDKINSFFTIDQHKDYVRAMSFCKQSGRLFSVSDDGVLIVNDLMEQKIV